MLERTPEVQEAINRRLTYWLRDQKDSPGKRLAQEVAELWDAQGEQAAADKFRSECRARKLVLWEQCAISDMVVAYRAKYALEGSY